MREWTSRLLRGRALPLNLLRWGLEAAGLVMLVVVGSAMISAVRLALADGGEESVTRWEVSPVPVYGQLAPFELEDERGEPYGTRQLRGGVYILQFTSSADERLARLAVERIALLQAHLAAADAPAQVLTVDFGLLHRGRAIPAWPRLVAHRRSAGGCSAARCAHCSSRCGPCCRAG